ncbi:hypothetical protein BDN72DRAFT_959960 [Pluteus cervinus]|uniref:Uncharacterized protein n=1 Tax=Pluteus cervinus TaxID=181527 RepID=A0ACD3AT54_9AGAR|nr:hypothetical protein BDN72DRAFT_959960 [Pluteus cervinus]
MPKHPDPPPADLHDGLQALLDYQPPQLSRDPDYPPGIAYSPLDFYDLHLHESLRLKRVVLLPDLVTRIASRVEQVRLDLESEGLIPPYPVELVAFGLRSEQVGRDNTAAGPNSLATIYERTIARSCLPLASQWIFHPRCTGSGQVIGFDHDEDLSLPNHEFVVDKWTLRIKPFQRLPTLLRDSLNRKTSLSLRALEKRPLATWFFMPLSPDADSALEEMAELASQLSLLFPTTTGHPHSQGKEKPLQHPPKDSPRPIISLPEAGFVPKSPSAERGNLIYPQGSKSKTPLQRSPRRLVSGSDLVQHAWTHAVRHDTTFLIMNTGNFERIAIRHRASQTLYLSGIVDVSQCENPAYGKIHAGLYLSIVQDALDRMQQVMDHGSDFSAVGKRKRKETILPVVRKSARQEVSAMRTRMTTPRVPGQDEAIWKSLNNKILGLIYVDDGVFGSSTPASCARVRPSLSQYGSGKAYSRRRRKFTHYEAVKIVLGPCLATGGTGILHYATIYVDRMVQSQIPYQVGVIVKLAITPRSRRHLHHEYTMYEQLWRHNVQGILPVYGLFEDYEGVTTMLVLGRGGIPLHRRDHGLSDESFEVTVNKKERYMFMSILLGVHRAGVRHGDLHPGNLLVDATGQGYLIDFDQSYIGWDLQSQKAELKALYNLLDGRWTPQSPQEFTCSSVSNLN